MSTPCPIVKTIELELELLPGFEVAYKNNSTDSKDHETITLDISNGTIACSFEQLKDIHLQLGRLLTEISKLTNKNLSTHR